MAIDRLAAPPQRLRWIVSTALIAFLGALLSAGAVDVDIWHEMALAREICVRHAIPDRDLFAYTPTWPIVVHHEWGAGLIAYGVGQVAGAPGLALLRLLLTGILCTLCWRTARRRGASLAVLRYATALPAALAKVGFALVRAHQYSFIFTAWLLGALDEDRRGNRRWLWQWLFWVVLWANLHGGVAWGLCLLGAHIAEQHWRGHPVRHLWAALLGGAALLCVNPWGWHYYTYLLRALTMPRPHIGEWAGLLQEASPAYIAVYVVSLGLALWAFWRQGRKASDGWAILLVTALASLKAYRLACFYAIAWFCYVPGWLERLAQNSSKGRAWLNDFWGKTRQQSIAWTVLTIVFLALIVVRQPWRVYVPGTVATAKAAGNLVYPVAAVDYLQAHSFYGNVMTFFDWGAYVSWRLYPTVRVGMDSRYEVAYPPEALERNIVIYNAEGAWQRELAAYGTRAVIVERHRPLALALARTRGWRCAYQDEIFQIWVVTDDPQLPPGKYQGQAYDGTFP